MKNHIQVPSTGSMLLAAGNNYAQPVLAARTSSLTAAGKPGALCVFEASTDLLNSTKIGSGATSPVAYRLSTTGP
jgi:hypothetical protein